MHHNDRYLQSASLVQPLPLDNTVGRIFSNAVISSLTSITKWSQRKEIDI